MSVMNHIHHMLHHIHHTLQHMLDLAISATHAHARTHTDTHNSSLTITLKSRLDMSSRIFETNIFLFLAGNSKIHFWHSGKKDNYGENFSF